MADTQTLPGKLASEISRVTELREQYKSLRGMPHANPNPAIFLMDVALKEAIAAAGSPDVAAQIRAVRELETFSG